MQLAAAMAYMHERGVIHGDLSRANILLADSDDSPSGFDVKVHRAALLSRLSCLPLHLLLKRLPLGVSKHASGVRTAAKSWLQAHLM